MDLIVTGNPGDPLQIYIENLDAEEAVKFLIRGREYSDMLEPKTIERGFVVASYPDPEISDKDAQVIVVSGTGDEFEHSLTLTGQSGKIYYRAYALNAEGVTYGSTSYIEMDEKEVSPRWADASSLDGTEGWLSSPWLGEFYRVDDSGWLMHENWAGSLLWGMTPQPSGYGRRDWAGYGQEATFIPSFTVMIQVRGYSFMARAQAIGFYSMTTSPSTGRR